MPDINHSPRKKSKSPREETAQDISSSLLTPPNNHQKINSPRTTNPSVVANSLTAANPLIRDWLDTLEEADVLEREETYSYSDMPLDSVPFQSEISTRMTGGTGNESYDSSWLWKPGFRELTLPKSSMILLCDLDTTPDWVQ
ncbi:hypothetical protein F4811DRAFT_71577 [Daldinia bambusicola]|nr:hypothetical protein F4811DRAFT_71577 [Daldinia bambusicola]